MNRKTVCIVVFVFTIFLIGMILFLNRSTSYKKLVVSKDEWESIQESRSENNRLEIGQITFDDKPVIVDQNNHSIYYMDMEPIFEKKQPIRISQLNKGFHIAIIEENPIQVMIYTDYLYEIFQLQRLERPMIHITYSGIIKKTKDVNILFIDNNNKSSKKIINSEATITLTNQRDYIISLRKESVGRNKRENDISIFGMNISHDFLLNQNKTTNNTSPKEVELFINQEYQGVYFFEYNNRVGG